VPCDAGYYSVNASANACQICPEGFAQPASAQSSCELCSAGRFSKSGASACDECPPATIAPLAQSSNCLACDINAFANPDRTNCLCRAGFYLDDAHIDTNATSDSTFTNIECRVCPAGFDCAQPGEQWSTIRVQPGHWRESLSTTTCFRCNNPQNCLGGHSSVCDSGRIGPLCALCLDGYSSTTPSAPCTKCPSAGDSLLQTVGIMLALIIAIVVMYWAILKSGAQLEEQFHRSAERESKWDQNVQQQEFNFETVEMPIEEGEEEEENNKAQFSETVAESGKQILDDPFILQLTRKHEVVAMTQELRMRSRPNFTYKMKIMVSFFQIITSVAFLTEVPWPRMFQSFISVFTFFNLDFVPWGQLGCVATIPFYTKMIIVGVTPIGIFALITLLFLAPSWIRDRFDMSDSDTMRAVRATRRRKFWRLIMFTVFLMYPKLSSTMLSMFVCKTVNGQTYLVADMTLRCLDDRWMRYLPFGILFIFVYPIGIPTIFFVTLFQHRKSFKAPLVLLQIGFLYEPYNPAIWWFELCDMINKLTMTSLVSFLYPYMQMPAAMIWTAAFMVLILFGQPYIRKADDRLQLLCSLEVYLLASLGHTLNALHETTLSETVDVGMSVIMIMVRFRRRTDHRSVPF